MRHHKLAAATATVLLVIGITGCSDDGGNDDNLNNNSSAALCGDGVVEGAEECDDGASNSDVAIDACRTDCRRARCGDGVVDTGETCDAGPGNSDQPGAACRLSCGLPTCGDGVLDAGEQCDDGEANSSCTPDACRPSCALPHCGDRVLDTSFDGVCNGAAWECADCTETCDDCDGDGYGTGAACRGEDCDDADPLIHEGCDVTCSPATCAGGCCVGTVCVVFAHQNLDVCGTAGGACVACATDQACSAEGQCTGGCGDGVVGPGETCDEGDALNGTPGHCNATCTGMVEDGVIVFTRGADAPRTLHSVAFDGSGERLLATDVGTGGTGGGKICYSDDTRIVVIDLDGTHRVEVPNTLDVSYLSEVDCSPDGTRIVYSTYDGSMEGLQLFLIDVDGSEKTLFSDGMGNYRQQRFPSWNVAGYIVFGTHSMGYDWEANLYRLDVASAGGTPTALNPGYAQFPAAGGPAGLIAWSTPSGTLNVMSSDGTGVTPLPATGTSTGKAWQPDTSTLFYVKDGDIWRINADGTEDARVTTGASVVSILGAE